MFQNGMPEEVQNYFVPEDATKHHSEPARGYQTDQALFRGQYIDPRMQMMGQHLPHFPYMKVPNGDFFDPRMLQNRQQQQQFFEPVQTQQPMFDQSFQAMQMEKLARQQEYFLSHQAHGLGMQQPARPQMGTPQMDGLMRSSSMQTSPIYGVANESAAFVQQRPLDSFQSESEAIDNLHELFGGVEKLFADDPVEERKSAIPGLGSLGASLINGCEAELFGDGGAPFFGRNMHYPFRQPVDGNRNLTDHASFSQPLGQMGHLQGTANHIPQQQQSQALVGNYPNDGHFQQYGQSSVQQQALPQRNERWHNSKNINDGVHSTQQGTQMARGTLQLFKDIDENENSGQSGYQTPGSRETSSSRDAFRPVGTTASLGVQDGGHRSNDTPQVRIHQNSEGAFWMKDSNVASSSSYQQGEGVSQQTTRLQPDRLLLDSGKQHQSDEVQKLLSFGNSSLGTVPSEDSRLHNHQTDSSVRSRIYFEALEQHKQQQQNVARASYSNGTGGFPQIQPNASYDSTGDGKINDIQTGQPGVALPWNVSNARQSTPDSMQRGNSSEPFKSPVPKAVFGSSSMSLNDKPTPSEPSIKRREDLFLDNTSAATASSSGSGLMDRGSFIPDNKQSKNMFQLPEKPEMEAPEQRQGSMWQNHGVQFPPNMLSTLQDINRRHFSPKSDGRAFDLRQSRPQENFSGKDKDDLPPAAKVFESSAPSNVKQIGSPSMLQSPSSSLNRSEPPRFAGQYAHKPTESDSINDIVQLQHQSRVSPSPAQVPQAPIGKPEQGETPDGSADRALSSSSKAAEEVTQDMRPSTGENGKLETIPNQLGISTGAVLSHPAFAAMAQTKMATPPQQFIQVPKELQPVDLQRLQASQVPKELQPVDLQRLQAGQAPQQLTQVPKELQPMELQRLQTTQASDLQRMQGGAQIELQRLQAAQAELQRLQGGPMQGAAHLAQVAMHQQRVQAALQAYAMGKGGAYVPDLSAVSVRSSSSEPSPVQGGVITQSGTSGQTMVQGGTAIGQAMIQGSSSAGQSNVQDSTAGSSAAQIMNPVAQSMVQAGTSTAGQTMVQGAGQAMVQGDSSAGQTMFQGVTSDGQSTVQGGTYGQTMIQSGTGVAQSAVQGAVAQAMLQGSAGAVGQAIKQQLMLNSTFASSVLPKKRKNEVPPLVPWRTAISQLTGALPTIRPAELQWAVDTNRLPEKDIDEEYYNQDEGMQFVGRARQRLRLTTQLMQHTLPPVPAALMQSNNVEDRECAMYVLARLSLGEACRITANEDASQAKTNTLAATSELIIKGCTERIQYLEKALQRLENLPLTLEFVKNMQYLDKVCVTNRLMKCHQELFPVNYASQRRIQPVQRSYPQPYVAAVPMPSTIPEGFQLVSL